MPFGVFSRVVYYHPDVQRLVAQRHAVVTGNNASTSLTPKLLRSNQATCSTLGERTAEKAIRRRFSASAHKEKPLGHR